MHSDFRRHRKIRRHLPNRFRLFLRQRNAKPLSQLVDNLFVKLRPITLFEH